MRYFKVTVEIVDRQEDERGYVRENQVLPILEFHSEKLDTRGLFADVLCRSNVGEKLS